MMDIKWRRNLKGEGSHDQSVVKVSIWILTLDQYLIDVIIMWWFLSTIETNKITHIKTWDNFLKHKNARTLFTMNSNQTTNKLIPKVMIYSKYLTTSSTTRASTSQFIRLQKQPFIESALWVKCGWTLIKLKLVFTFVTYFIKKMFL